MGLAVSAVVLLVAIAIYATYRAVVLRRSRARSEERDGGAPRPAHYAFTRHVLAMGVLKTPDGIERLLGPQGAATVAAAFRYATDQHPFGEPLSSAPSLEPIEGGALVVMPPAERRGEAELVAAVRATGGARYFLLEKAEAGWLFVELVLQAGQLASKESFAGSMPSKELFITEIARRLREPPKTAPSPPHSPALPRVPSPRALHYAFAHRVLPRHVQQDAGFAVELLRNPARAVELWNETAATLPPADALDSRGLRVQAWGKSGNVVLVHMPAPEQPLEAYVVAVTQRSCFVLERGVEGPFISEWTLHEGEGTFERTRYDEALERPDVEVFAAFVVRTQTERGEPVICCPYCILPIGNGWDACPFCARDPRRDARIEYRNADLYYEAERHPCQTCAQACLAIAVVCPECKGRPFPA